jgi:hypothetical protein
VKKPKTRGDCKGGFRPCPWVSCRHHLLLNVVGCQVLRPHGHDDPSLLVETCALDVVDANPDGLSVEAVAQLTGAPGGKNLKQRGSDLVNRAERVARRLPVLQELSREFAQHRQSLPEPLDFSTDGE